MSTAQIQKCAERLDPHDAAEFKSMHEAATALIRRGIELRRKAWAMYREKTGLLRRADQGIFR
jgi:hypothetical protein